MNDSKTEAIHISSRFVNVSAMPPLTVGTSSINTSDSVRNPGVIIDSHISMSEHANSICRSVTIAIRKIGQIRPYLNQGYTERLVHVFITSRLDSCNSILYGLSDSQIMKLQRIQNTTFVARLVAKTWQHHSCSAELHWLPVKKRIVLSSCSF